MEDTLRDIVGQKNKSQIDKHVLILIIMEDTLRDEEKALIQAELDKS